MKRKKKNNEREMRNGWEEKGGRNKREGKPAVGVVSAVSSLMEVMLGEKIRGKKQNGKRI